MDLLDLQASISLDASDYIDALSDAASATEELSSSLEGSLAESIEGLESGASAGAQGVDGFSISLNESRFSLSDFESEVMGASSELKDVGGTAVSSSEMLATLGTSAAAAGAAIVAGIGVAIDAVKQLSGEIWNAMSQTASYLDQIDKESQKINISTQAYQEWSYVFENCGASISTMRASMRTLATQAEKNSDAFAKIGVSVTDANGAMKSQEQLFSDVITGLQGMEAGTERTALAQQLLGRGSQELAALLNTSAEDTAALKQEVADLGGIMSEEAVKAGAHFQDMLLAMTTGLNAVKNQTISEFLPGFSAVMEGIASIIKGGEENIATGQSQIRVGIQGILATAAAVIPDFLETGGQIVLAIAEGIISEIPAAVASIPQVIESLYETIIDNKDMIRQAGYDLIDALAAGVPGAIPVVLAVINDLGAAIFNLLLSFVSGMLAKGAELINGLASGISSGVTSVLASINAVGAVIVGGIIAFFSQMVSSGAQLVSGLASGISNAVSTVISAARNVVTRIVTTIKSLKSQLVTAGLHLIQGLVEGIKHKASDVINAAKGVVSDAIAGAKALLGIASPSRVFKQIGAWTMEGFEIGLLSKRKSVLTTIEEITTGITTAYIDAIQELQDQITAIDDAQAAREEEKQAKERAERLADLEAKVAAAVGDEREKAEAELQKQKDEWAEDELKKQEEANKKSLNEQISYLQKMQDAYQDALDEIEDQYSDTLKDIGKQQDSMADKMKSYSDLFSWEQKKNGSILNLTNLDSDIQAMQNYSDVLNALRDRGVNSSLMDEILGMSIDNATAYGQKLLNMGEGTFISYMEKYAEKNAIADSIAAQWYSGDYATAEQTYIQSRESLNGQYLQNNDTAGAVGEIVSQVTNSIGDVLEKRLSILATIEMDGATLAKALMSPLSKEARRLGKKGGVTI